MKRRPHVSHRKQFTPARIRQEWRWLREAVPEIEAARHRYADLYDFAPMGCLSLDRNGCVIDINVMGARLLGMERHLLMGQPLLPLIATGDRRKYLNHLARLRAGTTRAIAEVSLTRRDGTTPPVVQLLSIRADQLDQTRVQYRTAMMDVTERRRAEEELREAHRLLETRVAERTAELSAANDSLQREIAERARLERRVVEISDQEQQRIGRELHDSVGQALTGVALMLDSLRQELKPIAAPQAALAGRVAKLARHAAGQLHDIAGGLFPSELQRGGLASALQELAGNAKVAYRTKCRFTVSGTLPALDHATAGHLFRIAQEAVNNAGKHSRASHIEIELAGHTGEVRLSVRDDGVGLRPTGAENGMGLQIMNHRASLLGAQLEIDSRRRGGTTIRCVLQTGKQDADK